MSTWYKLVMPCFMFSHSTHALNFSPGIQSKVLKSSRRQWIGKTSAIVVVSLGPIKAADSFENATPMAKLYADKPKRRGPQPKDLGVLQREKSSYDVDDEEMLPALKTCKSAPNCFSTTGDPEFDVGSMLQPWRPPKGYSPADTARDLEAAVRSYEPGQSGIDGAGFSVVACGVPTAQAAPGESFYLYAQFESLKQGYVDDLEFAVVPAERGSSSSSSSSGSEGGQAVQVLLRSSSRVGYLDYNVNAKRLNFLSSKLRVQGWTAPTIDKKSHTDYFLENAQV